MTVLTVRRGILWANYLPRTHTMTGLMTDALESFECEEVVGNIKPTTSGFSPWVSNILFAANGFMDVNYTVVGDADDVIFND